MDVYVIYKSINDDMVYKLDAWSKNYYLAKLYYNQFDSNMYTLVKYECNNMVELARMVSYDSTSSDVNDIFNSMLKSTTSMDNKLFALYRNEQSMLFNKVSDKMNPSISIFRYTDIVSSILIFSLNIVASLSDYIRTDDIDIMYFVATLCKSSVNIRYNIDSVYLWRFILSMRYKIGYTKSIVNNKNITPDDILFIDNNI